MAAYSIEFAASAEREFRRLPGDIQRRFAAAFRQIEKDPRRRRPGCDVRLLSGVANAWRLRVGDCRGICGIDGESVVFTRFGHRRNIYAP